MTKKIPKETTAKFHRFENVEVSNLASAGASARVLNFPTDREKVTLPLPEDLAKKAKNGYLDVVTLQGDSLEGIGLFDGDRVICRVAVTRREVKADDICIVYVEGFADSLAKMVIFDGKEVILKSFNPDIPDLTFHRNEVEIQGIILELLSKREPDGTFFRIPRSNRISRTERKQRVAAAIKSMQKPVEEEKFEF